MAEKLEDFDPLVALLQVQTLAVDFGTFLRPGVKLANTPVAPTVTVTTDSGTDASPQTRLTAGPSIGTLSVAEGGTGKDSTALFFQLSGLRTDAAYKLVYSCSADNGDVPVAFNHIHAKTPS